jgi:hypothetical protein
MVTVGGEGVKVRVHNPPHRVPLQPKIMAKQRMTISVHLTAHQEVHSVTAQPISFLLLIRKYR